MKGGKFWAGDRKMDLGDRTEASGLMRVGDRVRRHGLFGQIVE